MGIAQYIRHPEKLNADTLQQLRRQLEKYPYFQTARLLLLQNLHQEHSELFERELRRSAVLVGDRKVLFDMIEGQNYILQPEYEEKQPAAPTAGADRMLSLIDDFLESVPDENIVPVTGNADASTDYMTYLQQEDAAEKASIGRQGNKGRSGMRLALTEKEEYESPEEENMPKEAFFTETLAKIFIKQQKYDRALEIIRALSADNPKKNAYFADQIQFLEKLIALKTKK